jgi:hypothetical protein
MSEMWLKPRPLGRCISEPKKTSKVFWAPKSQGFLGHPKLLHKPRLLRLQKLLVSESVQNLAILTRGELKEFFI